MAQEAMEKHWKVPEREIIIIIGEHKEVRLYS